MLISKKKIILYSALLFVLSFSFFINTKTSFAAGCEVKSATFIPSGEKPDGWYQDADRPSVKVDIVTQNCEGKTIEVSITEEDGLGFGFVNDDDLTDSGLDNKPITVTSSNHIIMHLRAGEEACEAGAGHDCNYYISIYGLDDDYSSENKPGGNLVYECDTSCLNNWTIEKIYQDVPIGQTVTISPNPPASTDTKYKLLQPLPGLEEPIDTQTNKDTNPCPFGKYFNILIKLFFGIAGVLAVVMIVMAGIQYMTSDFISSKEEAKNSITNVIFGLLLALGAWLILNTINPDLLNVCLNTMQENKATITISEENVANVGPGINVGGNTIKIKTGSAVKCSGGIVQIPSNIGSGKICKDLLDRLQILKQKYPNWRITSTLRGGSAQSSCHYEGFPNSGNCVDLQINSSNSSEPGYSKENGSPNQAWGEFCIAVAQTGGLNYLNEASKMEKCEKIKQYKAEKYTTGPHLHVNFIGN